MDRGQIKHEGSVENLEIMKEETAPRAEQSAKMMLLRAGIRLFAEKGYAGTSVREIVAKAGVTKPVLYYYFKSKEGLFRAILDWAAGELEMILAKTIESPGTSLEKFLDLYQRIYQGLTENRPLFRLINNLFFGPPQGAPAYDIEQFHQRMVDVVEEICVMGLHRGELREANPEEAAFLVLGVIDYCFHLEYLHPKSMQPEKAEKLLRLAFRGLERDERGRHERPLS